MADTTAKRLLSKVAVSDGCWEWTATTNQAGYGIFRVDTQTRTGAHRAVYELLVGPIPDGMELDHLCRNRGCVNPSHLEPVTHAENVRRGESDWRPWQQAGVSKAAAKRRSRTHCKRGHAFTPENTRETNGRRVCRACARENQRRHRKSQAESE